ncbi:urease accessory protein UreF [Nereida sp. MMG025]|uniref:urease accessory protein UreF n=1 Tax=Nereida sp. MMG025 TaxID=2909981 RepID=UPI001F1EDD58|nr:urease accessory protein UreF [Nereida sp. MMG025]MCF6444168.1 urease accessory protein UreF [Nereida sp. MMG025]
MNTEILTLSQWLSPAYPIGAFAYSHGLEAAISAGWIKDAADLQDWLSDILVHGSGRNDCILLRAAHAGDVPVGDVNSMGLAFAASAERQRETLRQGAAFVKTTAHLWNMDDAPLIYPVAVGAAAGRLGIDPTLACAMFLQATLSNLVQAAQRLMALGQTQGQAIVKDLTPACQKMAQDTHAATLDNMASCAFLSDIAAMRHETQTPRIFQT